jgi:ubiquinone/menaquinone biosynthesis C-methylase UbiE
MLGQAVRESNPPNVAYVRGDAGALPFTDGSFDAVCCFAALYFIEEPMRAIDEIVRVLAPGGRVALLSSVARGVLPAGLTDALVRRLSGTRVFGPDELTGALQERGLSAVDRRLAGFAQFVSARAR